MFVIDCLMKVPARLVYKHKQALDLTTYRTNLIIT